MIRKFPGRLLTPLQNTWPSVKYIMARYPNDSKSENGCSLVPIMEPHVYIIYPTLDEHPVLPVQELEKVRQAIPDGFLGFQWRNWSLIVVQLEQQGKGVMEPVTFTTGCSSMMNGNEKEMLNKWEKTLDQFTMTVSAERLFGLDPKQEKRGKMGVKL
ncbi:hypothetical protein VKT23_010897 [Stygiomarasmius scandens]|uniref:Uncharacterized protein n=1 Tax=Marasmiellus scandens TaxID=2682957 RepID=A0ABR1JAI2_9AGAR